MEGNPNDKAYREKLLEADYPFDPAAWGQMEKMLDQKKKRGIIFWWSTLGIAASLLMGMAVYTAINNTANNKQTAINSPSQKHASDKLQITINNKASGTTELTTTTNSDTKAQSTTADANAASPQNTSSSSSTTTDHNYGASGAKTKHPASKPQPWNGYQFPHSTEAYPMTASAAPLSRTLTEASQIELNSITLNAVNHNGLMDNTEEPAVASIPAKLKKKKISITYKLGVDAGLYEAFAAKTFADRPTWAVGISEELMIGKYFAITSGIMYSELNFKVNKPAYPDNNYMTLDNYRSHVKEIAIPIGVKVYPYSSKLVKIGIGISYVNHVKISEGFDYKTELMRNTAYQFSDLNTVFPSVNTFSPAIKSIQSLSVAPDQANVLGDYYAIGNAHRYYGSIMYTAGVEIALPKRFCFTAEPCFMMSLDKIRMQDSRVFDFGLNTGVKYAF